MSDFQTQGGRPQPVADQAGQSFKENAARMGEYVADQARTASEKTGRLAGEVAAAARERPYTTIAIAAGLAFALGALWKARSSRQQSHLDAFLARLPDLQSRNLWPRAWR